MPPHAYYRQTFWHGGVARVRWHSTGDLPRRQESMYLMQDNFIGRMTVFVTNSCIFTGDLTLSAGDLQGAILRRTSGGMPLYFKVRVMTI